MVNKDVTHPRMRRLIKNPRIVLLDCSLEYKKGESQVRCCLNPQSSSEGLFKNIVNWPLTSCSSQTDIEITREEDFARILQMEEEYIQQICEDIIRLKPDLVFTEKGVSGAYEHSWSHVVMRRNGVLFWSCELY